MAKSLKTILGNDKKLEGVKSSSKEKLDLGGYAPKPGDEKKFVAKHEVEKFADRAGNKDVPYVASTKEAPVPRQPETAYENAPVVAAAPKKTLTEKVESVLAHMAEAETIFKFKNGEKAIIETSVATSMKNIFNSLTEENKNKFAEIAFNSPEDFYSISDLKE
jgi:hypothetical protein